MRGQRGRPDRVRSADPRWWRFLRSEGPSRSSQPSRSCGACPYPPARAGKSAPPITGVCRDWRAGGEVFPPWAEESVTSSRVAGPAPRGEGALCRSTAPADRVECIFRAGKAPQISCGPASVGIRRGPLDTCAAGLLLRTRGRWALSSDHISTETRRLAHGPLPHPFVPGEAWSGVIALTPRKGRGKEFLRGPRYSAPRDRLFLPLRDPDLFRFPVHRGPPPFPGSPLPLSAGRIRATTEPSSPVYPRSRRRRPLPAGQRSPDLQKRPSWEAGSSGPLPERLCWNQRQSVQSGRSSRARKKSRAQARAS